MKVVCNRYAIVTRRDHRSRRRLSTARIDLLINRDTMSVPDRITIKVPATTANLGPGFDAMGMALDLWNTVTVTPGNSEVSIEGEGEDELPRDESNVVVAGINSALRALGKSVPELAVRCENRIPLSRGLGSSSAATVAGLLAGLAMAGRELDQRLLFNLAADIEGHPDNAAPAVYGGCCISVRGSDGWVVDQTPLPENLNAVAFIPDVSTNTSEARAVLPSQVSREDAVFNLGRTALFVNALATGRLELLRHATEDRLHQPQRGKFFPAMKNIIRAALDGGAHGAFLSGAGPTVMALTTGREVTVLYEMSEAARKSSAPGRAVVLRPTTIGAHVVTQ